MAHIHGVPSSELWINSESQHTQNSQWIPPRDSWKSENGYPYGWEGARDENDQQYFINHVNRSVSNEDPREPDVDDEPEPRTVLLQRDDKLGFGFVAGSEKPVVVRFVTEGGPSEGKLLPGDRILEINEEDVERSAREHVIELVRSCRETIQLRICQPVIDNSQRKSAMLTAAKKARLKSNPSRVRFAEPVSMNGSSVITPSNNESYIPFMPNVLKVFLENGQTKSFKYDNQTTVKEVLESLQEKLSITCMEYFSLVLQNMKESSHTKMSLLQEHEALADIASKPGSHHFKCLFRLVFVPADAYELLGKDRSAFDYFYMQCCTDVLEERFGVELKYDLALRLAALQIHEHCLTNNMKVSLKNVEREVGLDKFISESILETIKGKELRKMLSHYLKTHQQLGGPGNKQLNPVQTKLHYLKMLGELKSFGAKCFLATHVERSTEIMVLVGPRYGVANITEIKSNRILILCKYKDLDYITVAREERETMLTVQLHIKDDDSSQVSLTMLSDEISDFVAMVEGYYHINVDPNKCLFMDEEAENNNSEGKALPPFAGRHKVKVDSWNYIQTTEEPQQPADEEDTDLEEDERVVDLSKSPPTGGIELDLIKETPESREPVDRDESHDISRDTVAPLASPDVSTISGSSDSSTLNNHDNNRDTVESPLSDNRDSVISESNETFGVKIFDNSDNARDIHTILKTDDVSHLNSHVVDSDTSSVTSSTRDVTSSTFSAIRNSSPRTSTNSSNSSHSTLVSSRSSQGNDRDLNEGESHTDTESEHTVSAEYELKSREDSDVDSDSFSTPTDSPIKRSNVRAKPPSTLLSKIDRPQSFGLHSPSRPEQEIRKAKKEDENIPLDKLHPAYNPKLFCNAKDIYYDPELIDLTLLPPPKTPESEETLIDFNDMTAPPPDFNDPNFAAAAEDIPEYLADLPDDIRTRIDSLVLNNEELGGIQLGAMEAIMFGERNPFSKHDPDHEKESGIESETDSGNETISSENIEIGGVHPDGNQQVDFMRATRANKDMVAHLASRASFRHVDFNTDDIEAFIASVSVPPPPKDEEGATGGSNEGYDTIKPAKRNAVSANSFKDKPKRSNSNAERPPQKPQRSHKPKFNSDSDTLGKVDLLAGLPDVRSVPNDVILDDDFAQYVIPPPPVDSSMELNLDDLRIVPPVDVKTPSPGSIAGSPPRMEEYTINQDPLPPNVDLINHVTQATNHVTPPQSQNMTPSNQNITSSNHNSFVQKYIRSVSAVEASRPTPPPQPTRQSSLSSIENPPTLSTFGSPQHSQGLPNVRKPLWRPITDTISRSADSSPVHEPLGSRNSTGTIQRPNKRPPPPPPRRGSSISNKPIPEYGDSLESVADRIRNLESIGFRHSVDGALNPESTKMATGSTVSLQSTASLQSTTSLQSTASTTGSTHSSQSGHSSVESEESVKQRYSQKQPHGASQLASLSEDENLQPPDSPRNKLKAFVSPNILRRQEAIAGGVKTTPGATNTRHSGERNSASEMVAIMPTSPAPLSPNPHQPLTQTSSSSLPRSSFHSSPHASPTLHRHESFSESAERSPSPFRTFLGDRASSSHQGSDTDSAPSSPRKGSQFHFPHATIGRSDPRNAPPKRNGIPFKVVRPMVNSGSSSDNESPAPSLTFPSGRAAPPSRSINFDGSSPDGIKLPSWKSGSGGSPNPKSPNPDSPIKTGMVSSLRQALSKTTTSFGTFGRKGGKKEAPPTAQSLDTGLKARGQADDSSNVNNDVLLPECSIMDIHDWEESSRVIQYVLDKKYTGPMTFSDANSDVDKMVYFLQKSMEIVGSLTESDKSNSHFKDCKDKLVVESRQFVTDSKMLVSSATQSKEKLQEHVDSSIHTLARIVYNCTQTMTSMNSVAQAVTLGSRVKEVNLAYQTTVNAASDAAGKPLSDPHMKMLMRQATTLAAILSSLMKTLKQLDGVAESAPS